MLLENYHKLIHNFGNHNLITWITVVAKTFNSYPFRTWDNKRMDSARLESLTFTIAVTRWFRIIDRFLFYYLETEIRLTIIINSQLRRTSITYRLAIIQHCSSKCRNVLCLMTDAATLHNSATLIRKMAFINRHK